jgi:hypothetical protein
MHHGAIIEPSDPEVACCHVPWLGASHNAQEKAFCDEPGYVEFKNQGRIADMAYSGFYAVQVSSIIGNGLVESSRASRLSFEHDAGAAAELEPIPTVKLYHRPQQRR